MRKNAINPTYIMRNNNTFIIFFLAFFLAALSFNNCSTGSKASRTPEHIPPAPAKTQPDPAEEKPDTSEKEPDRK